MTPPTHDDTSKSNEPGVIRVLQPRERDLGDFSVRRILPAAEQRAIGPFVFLDHMGPADFAPGEGIQVRPHPHIGLATITYLFEGEIIHRDDLGYTQPIAPKAVNLMVAGRGIVHSERASTDLSTARRLHGIQSWIALPDDDEECDPDFLHYPANDIPELTTSGCRCRVVMGAFADERSPVKTFSPTLYLVCELSEDANLQVPIEYDECAAYIVSGRVRIGARDYDAGSMVVIDTKSPERIVIASADQQTAQCIIIGGRSVGKRHLWWNFVSSRKERIEQAKKMWLDQSFGKIEGDDEFIPLPER